MSVLCRLCGRPFPLSRIHDETTRRYVDRFKHEPFDGDAQYDAMFREVSSEWRSRGCEVIGERHDEYA